MQISTLTRIGSVLNAAAGSIGYDDLTVEGMVRSIESRSIFDTLKAILGLKIGPADQIELLEDWTRYNRDLRNSRGTTSAMSHGTD